MHKINKISSLPLGGQREHLAQGPKIPLLCNIFLE